MKYNIKVCAYFIVFLLFVAAGCQKKQASLRVGDTIPKSAASDLRGSKVAIPDDFKGQAVVIRFWADWCKSCEREMPEMDELYKKYRDKGFAVLAINAGQQKDVVEAFVSRLDISYSVFVDANLNIAKQYGVTGLPTTFLVDRNGVIRDKVLGEVDKETFEKLIRNIL